MRRNDKKIEDEVLINQILSNSLVCRIGLFDEEYPYIVAMNYGYKENALYCHCAVEGKKIELIRKNNKVAFEIEAAYEIMKFDISCKWTTKYRSIMGTGSIEIIDDLDKKIEGLDIIMQQHGKMENSYNEKHLQNIFILKLYIASLSAKQSGNW